MQSMIQFMKWLEMKLDMVKLLKDYFKDILVNKIHKKSLFIRLFFMLKLIEMYANKAARGYFAATKSVWRKRYG